MQTNAQLIIEVGVWKGSTTLVLAKWLASQGRGVILSVDTWLGALEFWAGRDMEGKNTSAINPDFDLRLHNGYPSVYYTFLSNVIHANVTQYVVPFPVPSRVAADFAAGKDLQADLIHIDAAHEYADVKEDIRLWWKIVRPGGVLLGDDYPDWAGVKKAVDEFAQENSLKLEASKYKWWVTKPM